jgi:hypothetical protein
MAVGGLLRGLQNPRSAFSQLARYGGGAAGAALGVGSAEPDAEPQEQLLRGAAGAVGGGMAIPGLMRAVSVGKSGPDMLTNALYFSYLSSPDTIARANLGAVGGMFIHGLEEMAQALLTTGSTRAKHVEHGRKLFNGVFKAGQTWAEVIGGDRKKVEQMRRNVLGDEYRFEVGEEFRDIGLGKWYTAGDLAAVSAMKKAGLSTKEAMRYTLTGTPETVPGQMLVGFQSKLLRDPGTGPAAYAKRLGIGTAMPFARVGVIGMEQGLKRINPFSRAVRGHEGEAAQRLARIRLGEGVGAGYAGYQAEEFDPRISQTAGTVLGPAFLPFAMGRGVQRAVARHPVDNLPELGSTIMQGAGEGLTEFNPLGYQPLGLVTNTNVEVPRRFVPSGISDVAEAMDPAFGRVTTPSELRSLAERGLTPEHQAFPGAGAFMGKMPILREQLPVQYKPVGPTGEPRFSSEEVLPFTEESPLARGLSRTMFPSRQRTIPPVVDMRDPQERALRDLGISRQAPSPTGSFMGFDYRPTQEAASEMQRLRGLGPRIAGDVLTSTPMMQQLMQLAQQNPQLARWLAQRMYRTLSTGVGQSTGLAANLIGLQGGRGPFGGAGG